MNIKKTMVFLNNFMKVTINFETIECDWVTFPDGYPKERYIWLCWKYNTTKNFHSRNTTPQFDYIARRINNKTYIKIEESTAKSSDIQH